MMKVRDFSIFSAMLLHSHRDQVSVSSGAVSQAAMVNAFVASDTKRSWKAMAMAAAGGGGGGVFQQSLGGGTKDYPL